MSHRAIGSHQGIEEEITTAYDASNAATWHVQVTANDTRVVSRNELNVLLRRGVVSPSSFAWRPGMTHWVQLQTLLEPSPKKETAELFSVQVGPGNIKHLTFEQLDDFYRYGIINEGTRIWQPGMPRWRTLGSVAGIDDEAPTKLHQIPAQQVAVPARSPAPPQPAIAPIVSPPARPNRPAGPPPLKRRPVAVSIDVDIDTDFDAPAVPTKSARPPPPIRSEQAHALPLAGAQPGRAPAPPTHAMRHATVPTQSARGVGPVQTARPCVVSLQPSYAAPASFRSPYQPQRSGKGGQWLLWFTLISGGLLALHRNDVLHSVAQRTPFASAYAQFERTYLGGPTFGTERSVERLVTAMRSDLEPIHLRDRLIHATASEQNPPAGVPSTRTLGDAKSTVGASESLPKDERAQSDSTPAIGDTTPASPPHSSATPAQESAGATTAPKRTTAVTRLVPARRRAGAANAQSIAKSFNEEVEAAMESAVATNTPRRNKADSAATSAPSAQKSGETESAPPTPKPKAKSALLEQIAAAVRAPSAPQGSTSNKSASDTPAK